MNGFISTLAITALVFVTGIESQAQERVGEVANYQLDRSRQRTTGMIKRGVVETSVAEHLPNDPAGPSYLVNLKYNLKVSFVGRKQGQLGLNATEEFFKAEFLEKLRKEKELQEPKFKIRHIGMGDAKLKKGIVYSNCDIVEIYDVDTATANSFTLLGLAYSVLQEAAVSQIGPEAGADIQNMEIKAYICDSIPVIGAAKIDMTGTTSGYDFKAGFDYQQP